MFGYSTVYLGRAAKVMALIASGTILLDIIGEIRIHAAAERVGRFLKAFAFWRRGWLELTFPGKELFQASIELIYALFFGMLVIGSISFIKFAMGHFDVSYSVHTPFGSFNLLRALDNSMMIGFTITTMPIMVRFIMLVLASVLSNRRLCWYMRCLAGVSLLTAWLIDFAVAS